VKNRTPTRENATPDNTSNVSAPDHPFALQRWAVYNTQTRLFSSNGNWHKTALPTCLFESLQVAAGVHYLLNKTDRDNSMIVVFDLTPSLGIVPTGSTAPNAVDEYRARQQRQILLQNTPVAPSVRSKTKL